MTLKEKAIIQSKISKKFLEIKKQQNIVIKNLEDEIKEIKKTLSDKQNLLKKTKFNNTKIAYNFIISECENHNIEAKTINSIFNL